MNEWVRSLRRLYHDAHAIDEQTVLALFKNGKITEDDKKYILHIE